MRSELLGSVEPMNLFQTIVDWVVSLMDVLGAPGVGAAVALENLFPPIPSEVVLPAAGFAAQAGAMSMVAAIVWATVGSTLGALALYGIGAALGRERFDALAAKIPFVDSTDIDKTHAWFAKHGTKAVLLGRMVPVIRSLISIPAGIERMGLLRFTVYTTVGAGAWNTLLIGAGYLLGSQWAVVGEWIDRYQVAVFVLAGLALAVWIGAKVTPRLQASRA